MSKLQARAETVKLAHLLATTPEELKYLTAVPAAEIRKLREAIEDSLFARGRKVFARLAAASRLLPVGVIAGIGERVFGAMLAARIAGEMPYPRAVEVALKMSVSFLADVCRHLDPRRTGDIVRHMPAARIAAVSAELLRRGEFAIMGRFVDTLAPDALRQVLDGIEDGDALLQTALFIEDKSRLGQLFELVTPAQLDLLAAAAARSPHAAEAMTLAAHLQGPQRERLGKLLSRLAPPRSR